MVVDTEKLVPPVWKYLNEFAPLSTKPNPPLESLVSTRPCGTEGVGVFAHRQMVFDEPIGEIMDGKLSTSSSIPSKMSPAPSLPAPQPLVAVAGLDIWVSVPLFPLPEKSWAMVPVASLKLQYPMSPNIGGACIVVDAKTACGRTIAPRSTSEIPIGTALLNL